MPQGRIVLKSICQSKKLASLKTDGARLLFSWLIPNVDINGCFSGDAVVVNAQIFTRLKKSTKTIQSYLQDLADIELIILYETAGDIFLCIPDHATRQPSLNPDKEAKPTIPPPTPEQLQSKSGFTPLKDKVKESKDKVKHLECVFLTPVEYQKLVEKFGQKVADDWIGTLDEGIAIHGYKYKSHYRVILKWSENSVNQQKPKRKSAAERQADYLERKK